LADYRLGELAAESGVSARNIRAYRERGLLDPPRREGRAAFYDDHHLAQLRTINELLGKGYTSAHIAEFFDTMRQGHDLADILGLQSAIFGHDKTTPGGGAGNVDPADPDALRLVAKGLAHEVDGDVRFADARTAEILDGVEDPRDYLRTMVRVSDGTAELLDDVAVAVVAALRVGLVDRFGTQYVPRPDDMVELNRMVRDYRRLANRVIAGHLDMALRRRLVQAMSDYTTDIIVSGDDKQP
jgi:DNA-binding transcriptional MerR regulator